MNIKWLAPKPMHIVSALILAAFSEGIESLLGTKYWGSLLLTIPFYFGTLYWENMTNAIKFERSIKRFIFYVGEINPRVPEQKEIIRKVMCGIVEEFDGLLQQDIKRISKNSYEGMEISLPCLICNDTEHKTKNLKCSNCHLPEQYWTYLNDELKRIKSSDSL